MNNHHENKIPILSFYSGGGFMDMGFEQAGFQIVWTNEYDKIFSELHAAGFSSWRRSIGNENSVEIFNTNSIEEISSETILEEAFNNKKPNIFGMIGGPPCQDFSMRGSLKGFNGEKGKMTTIYLNKVLELQPTFFVMENVTGLLKREETRNYLLDLLKIVELDYFIDYTKLNALDFGVPQHRERLFFVGVKKSLLQKDLGQKFSEKNWFPFESNLEVANCEKVYAWGTRNKFGLVPQMPEGVPLNLCVESCLVPDKLINSTPNANESFVLYKDILELNNNEKQDDKAKY